MFILSAVSILISMEVFEQYASKDTSFKQSEELVDTDVSATIILGFWPLKQMNYPPNVPYQAYQQWELGKDFTLTFGVTQYKNVQESVVLTEKDEHLEISHSNVGKVSFQKLTGKWGYTYKISANLIQIKQPFNPFVKIEFNEDIPDKDIPDLDLFITSEQNSLGNVIYDWRDGKKIMMNKVKGFLFLELEPKKVVKLKNCQEKSFQECFHSKLISEDYSKCPRKCFGVSSYWNAEPLCNTSEEFRCSYGIAEKIAKDRSSEKCFPSCTQINFEILNSYHEDMDRPDSKRNITIRYLISNDMIKVEEEYLINDFVKMLGSIGGTLGMCIGFSFLGVATILLQYLESFSMTISRTAPDIEHGVIQNNSIIEVKSKKNVNKWFS